jgi:hypothetical protein
VWGNRITARTWHLAEFWIDTAILNTHCEHNIAMTVAGELCPVIGFLSHTLAVPFLGGGIPFHFYWTCIFTFRITVVIFVWRNAVLLNEPFCMYVCCVCTKPCWEPCELSNCDYGIFLFYFLYIVKRFLTCVYPIFQKKNAEHLLGVTMQDNGSCEDECLLRSVSQPWFIF